MLSDIDNDKGYDNSAHPEKQNDELFLFNVPVNYLPDDEYLEIPSIRVGTVAFNAYGKRLYDHCPVFIKQKDQTLLNTIRDKIDREADERIAKIKR